MTEAAHRSRHRRGLASMLASSAAFGLSGSLATSLMRAGWSPGAAVLVRLALAATVLAIPGLLSLRGQRARIRRDAGMLALYGVVAVAGSQLCYFNAVEHLSVAVALLIEYSGILLVVAWTWLRHNKRPGPLTLAGGGLALAGLVLVLDLAGAHRLDLAGVLWGFGAAVGLAVYFLVSARRSDDELPPLAVAWGGLAVGAVVIALLAAAGALPLRASTRDVALAHHELSFLLPIGGLGVVAAALAYVAGIAGARRLGASLASFVGLAEVLFAVVAAWMLLGEALSSSQLAGGVLVVAGIALVRLEQLRGEAARRLAGKAGERPVVAPAAVALAD